MSEIVKCLIQPKKCLYENCNKRPSFGYKDSIALCCIDHKLSDHVYVLHKLCRHIIHVDMDVNKQQ